MTLLYSKRFLRRYAKLSAADRQKVDVTLIALRKDPHDPSLHNHMLHGSMKGIHAISVRQDLRILYSKQGRSVMLLLTVGTHDAVY